MKGAIEAASLAVQIDGVRLYVALPLDRMVMLLKLAESLGDDGKLPVTAWPSEFDAGPDVARLSWLVSQRVIFISGGRMDLRGGGSTKRGVWLRWPDDDRDQRGVYANARDAIDAAMEGRDA